MGTHLTDAHFLGHNYVQKARSLDVRSVPLQERPLDTPDDIGKLSTNAFSQNRRESVCSFTKRIVGKMRIPCCGLWLSMTQQLPDNR